MKGGYDFKQLLGIYRNQNRKKLSASASITTKIALAGILFMVVVN